MPSFTVTLLDLACALGVPSGLILAVVGVAVARDARNAGRVAAAVGIALAALSLWALTR